MSARSSSARFRSPNQRIGPSFAEAIERMKAGGLLRLQYVRSRPVWNLDDTLVSPETVALIMGCGYMEATGDALFPGAVSQTWRVSRVQ
jgi:hypothetical protein